MIRIEECDSEFGVITILRARHTGILSYRQGGFIQSGADADNVSLASYIHAIYGLLSQANSQSILMIGCGGGTLATMLWKSGCDVTVVDVNEQAFFLSRKYFGLPGGIACHIADGCEFLLADSRLYDACVLDAFAGDRIPDHVQSETFFRLARARLNPGGCIFVNVHVLDDFDRAPDQIATTMAKVWPHVRLLDISGATNRNAIAMAGAVRHLRKPDLEMRPKIGADEIDAELKAMQFRVWRARQEPVAGWMSHVLKLGIIAACNARNASFHSQFGAISHAAWRAVHTADSTSRVTVLRARLLRHSRDWSRSNSGWGTGPVFHRKFRKILKRKGFANSNRGSRHPPSCSAFLCAPIPKGFPLLGLR